MDALHQICGHGAKQLARWNGGRDSEEKGVSAGSEVRGNVPGSIMEVDREAVEQLDGEDIKGRAARDVGRLPVGEKAERCMHTCMRECAHG